MTETIKFYTIPQVAEMLQISKSTVYIHIDKGILPKPLEFGGARRFSHEQIEQAIEVARLRH